MKNFNTVKSSKKLEISIEDLTAILADLKYAEQFMHHKRSSEELQIIAKRLNKTIERVKKLKSCAV